MDKVKWEVLVAVVARVDPQEATHCLEGLVADFHVFARGYLEVGEEVWWWSVEDHHGCVEADADSYEKCVHLGWHST